MKEKILNFYQSSKLVRELLSSDRMFLENKMVMVKFFHKIALSV